MTTDTRIRSHGLQVLRAARTKVVAREGDHLCVYIATPVGWRLQCDPRRGDGELVVDPGLIARLDVAAVAA